MKNQQTPQFNYQTLWSRIEREAQRYAASPQAVRDFVTLISRRDFVKLLGASAAALALAGTAQADKAHAAPTRQAARPASSTPAFPNGVAAGDVDQTRVVLWARAANPGTVTFEVVSADGEAAGVYTAEVTDPMLPVKVAVEG
jgi:phosphodiesterase/alkaline phosphatase D-like protein